jgi:peptide deformylase
MKFEVIPNEQTPRVPNIEDIEFFFIQNINKLQAFKDYASTRFDAIGLAANQCSLDGERLMLRIFAFRNILTNDNSWKLIINPVVNEYLGIKDIKCEGCLTWRGKYVVAERNRKINVSYYNEIGERINGVIYKGLDAQVWQHEINHLNGIEEHIEERTYVPPKPIEVGRNEKCPCGSNLKYKQCCLI